MLLGACGDSNVEQNLDAGVFFDGGEGGDTVDAGAEPDGRGGPDVGEARDAGSEPDSGTAQDAAVDRDASSNAACTFNRDCPDWERCECEESTGCFCRQGARGTGLSGLTPCQDGNDCESALCVEGPGGVYYCSGECAGPEDCGPQLPLCASIAFLGRVCIREPPG